jgi:hypothetical protein
MNSNMLGRLKEWYHIPNGRRDYWAEVERADFIQDADIQREHQSQSLTLTFRDRIKDNNDAAVITFLTDGEAVHRDELFAGESTYSVSFDGYELDRTEYEIAIIDEEGQVMTTDYIRFHEE